MSWRAKLVYLEKQPRLAVFALIVMRFDLCRGRLLRLGTGATQRDQL
jgi:hypothetical protein